MRSTSHTILKLRTISSTLGSKLQVGFLGGDVLGHPLHLSDGGLHPLEVLQVFVVFDEMFRGDLGSHKKQMPNSGNSSACVGKGKLNVTRRAVRGDNRFDRPD